MKRLLFALTLISVLSMGTLALTAPVTAVGLDEAGLDDVGNDECDTFNADGAFCEHERDVDGPYGRRGYYRCTFGDPMEDGWPYYGYGAPCDE